MQLECGVNFLSTQIRQLNHLVLLVALAKNYLALKLIQNFALMTIFKIYVIKLTENYEHISSSNSFHEPSKKKSFNERLF